MTTTPDPLADLVVGRTCQIDTSPTGDGRVCWDLFVYDLPESAMARVAGARPSWCQIETRVTDRPPVGAWREWALEWLRDLGYDLATLDLVLILPDSVERLRP